MWEAFFKQTIFLMMATLWHSPFSSKMHTAQKMHFNCTSYVLNWLLVPLSILEKGFLYSADGEEKKNT